MEFWYKKHNVNKSHKGAGGKLQGPDVKLLLQERNLNELEQGLPSNAEHFISYLRSLRELHRICLDKELDTDFALVLNDYETNFDYLYTHFGLNMTLKCHVILHHYEFYFLSTGKTFRDTNGEFVETVHSSLRIHEESHGYKVVKQIGSPGHLKKSQQSITSFNSLRAGFCSPKDFTLRRKSSPHSSSPSPSPLSSPRSSHLYPLDLMF